MQTDILIIGGGLAGLSLADGLHRKHVDFQLLEARDRFGGRIQTERLTHGSFDVGPAWFWQGQPRIAALIDRLGLGVFNQYSDGLLSYENAEAQVERGRGFASMDGSLRLEGGLSSLIDGLVATLPPDRLHMSSVVTGLSNTDAGIKAILKDGTSVTTNRVILALPPRIAAQTITFSPALPASAITAMSGIATWMAGQAKAVAIYKTPFWRDRGLSGDAMSRYGPMVEIHDASPASNEAGALFGFVGIPPTARANKAALREQILDQFTRFFGQEAAEPEILLLKDWAFDPYTATVADQTPPFRHPQYGMPPMMKGLWSDQLLFSGTEVAPQFGGFLEGALESAENTLENVMLLPAAKQVG